MVLKCKFAQLFIFRNPLQTTTTGKTALCRGAVTKASIFFFFFGGGVVFYGFMIVVDVSCAGCKSGVAIQKCPGAMTEAEYFEMHYVSDKDRVT